MQVINMKALAVKSVALLVMGILCPLMWAEDAGADTVPGTAYFGPGFFFSRNMDPVTVSIWPKPALKGGAVPEGVPLVRYEIPRAYIFYAGEYNTQDKFRTLPDKIDAGEIGIMLTYPDGKPYSVALGEYRIEDDAERRSGPDALREVRYVAFIDDSLNQRYRKILSWPRRDENGEIYTSYEYIGEEYGLHYYETRHNSYFYSHGEGGYIFNIRCMKKQHPRWFCEYYIPLGGQTLAKVKFVDFRQHGGREFLDERVRAFRRALCPYFACSGE